MSMIATRRLRDAGSIVDLIGHPDNAPGGAARAVHPDNTPGGAARAVHPDGNVVLFDQRPAPTTDDRGDPAGENRGNRTRENRGEPAGEQARFSLIREAAAEAIARRGGAPVRCQIGMFGGAPCPNPAEVKLADPRGETVWVHGPRGGDADLRP
jgi:hypothetical protein